MSERDDEMDEKEALAAGAVQLSFETNTNCIIVFTESGQFA